MDPCCHPTLCLPCHCPLFPYFCVYVSSFPQGGNPPSQVTLEQIPQRRAIPTNIPTMSLWSVTSLLILRGQSSIMWRMIPRLRAVGTQVGSYTVDAACLIQFLHRDSPREKKLGQVRNVSHGKGERHRTWVIDWDEKKQHNSEWNNDNSITPMPVNTSMSVRMIVMWLLMWLLISKSAFCSYYILDPCPSHSFPITFVASLLIMFSCQALSQVEGFKRRGMFMGMGHLLITLLDFLKDRKAKEGKLACLLLCSPCREHSWTVLLICRRMCLLSVEEISTEHERKRSAWLTAEMKSLSPNA